MLPKHIKYMDREYIFCEDCKRYVVLLKNSYLHECVYAIQVPKTMKEAGIEHTYSVVAFA